MSIKEQYQLSFNKIGYDINKIYYRCNMIQKKEKSLALSELLNNLGKYSDGLLDEIQSAQSGNYFDEIYSFDITSGDFSLKIIPPNAVIEQMGYSYSISLIDLKQLLEEWIDFTEN